MAKLDPTQMADWQIAEAAEENMKSVRQLASEWGIEETELLPYGHDIGKVDYNAVLKRLGNKPNGKFIDVTAITPTPLGEGKSTTTSLLVLHAEDQLMSAEGFKLIALEFIDVYHRIDALEKK